MMKNLIIPALLALAMPAAALPPAEAEHPETVEPVEGACLVLERTNHDFGDIARRGGEVTAEFRFRNAGTAPLVLTRLTTTCSCLKSEYPKRPVPAGGTGTITLRYEPAKAEPGTFHRAVQVYSNSADGREILTIQGHSVDAR